MDQYLSLGQLRGHYGMASRDLLRHVGIISGFRWNHVGMAPLSYHAGVAFGKSKLLLESLGFRSWHYDRRKLRNFLKTKPCMSHVVFIANGAALNFSDLLKYVWVACKFRFALVSNMVDGTF